MASYVRQLIVGDDGAHSIPASQLWMHITNRGCICKPRKDEYGIYRHQNLEEKDAVPESRL